MQDTHIQDTHIHTGTLTHTHIPTHTHPYTQARTHISSPNVTDHGSMYFHFQGSVVNFKVKKNTGGQHAGKWIAVDVVIEKQASNPRFTTGQYAGNEPPATSDVSAKHFNHTHFLRLYRATPRRPTQDQVLQFLPPSQRDIFKKCLAKPSIGGHVGKACVNMWTHDIHTPYAKINNALLTDHSVELRNWVHFIRAFNRYLLDSWTPPRDMVTYRGSKLSAAAAQSLEVGQWYRISMYAATSMDKRVAEVFDHGMKFEFRIPKGCYQACRIASLSEYKDENEVLLVPYSPIRIIEKRTGWIVAEVGVDSMSMPDDQKSTLV